MKYDNRFAPPAPMVSCVFRRLRPSEAVAQASGLLDTGADISVVPQAVVERLGLVPYRHLEAQGYDGTVADYLTYLVNVELPDGAISDLEVIALPCADAIIGRDALNHFHHIGWTCVRVRDVAH